MRIGWSFPVLQRVSDNVFAYRCDIVTASRIPLIFLVLFPLFWLFSLIRVTTTLSLSYFIRVKSKVFTSLIDSPSTHRVPGCHTLTDVSGTRWCLSLPTPGQIEIPACAVTGYLTSCSRSKGHSFLHKRCTLLGEFRPPAVSFFLFLSDNLCFSSRYSAAYPLPALCSRYLLVYSSRSCPVSNAEYQGWPRARAGVIAFLAKNSRAVCCHTGKSIRPSKASDCLYLEVKCCL